MVPIWYFMLTPASLMTSSAVLVTIALTNLNSLKSKVNGIMISGSMCKPFLLLTAIAALTIALVCISPISG